MGPAIQNQVLRAQAEEFLITEFDKRVRETSEDPDEVEKLRKLRNLIDTLGSLFFRILVSDAAERRVFAVAFSTAPTQNTLEVVERGVRLGYLHPSSVGRKEGLGRTRLYVLSRRLAPYFNLDPSGYVGYKFLTEEFVKSAMVKPEATIRLLRTRGPKVASEGAEQLTMFSEEVQNDL